MHAVKLAHVFTTFHTLGGVEAVLQHHYAHDHRFNIHSECVAFYELPGPPRDRLHFLGYEGTTRIRTARKRFADAMHKIRPEVTVHHGMWGMLFWLDLDPAARRLLILHGYVHRLEATLASRAPFLDGILCVSEALRDTARSTLPGFDAQRIGMLPYPIQPEGLANSDRPLSRPIVLGFCGRLVREQKRVERLPVLCDALTKLKVDFRLEFLGDGPEDNWLRGELSGQTRYRFHGRRQGKEYWDILRSWDVIVFASDYEGTPIALLEALSQGVIPVFPEIGSGGDAYTRRIDPTLVYPASDVESLARLVRDISQMSPERISRLRKACIAAVQSHLGDSYLQSFSKHLELIRSLPRVSKAWSRVPPWAFQIFSFADVERLTRFGRRARSWFSPASARHSR